MTAGGELGFVRRILHDSLILRTQIRSDSSSFTDVCSPLLVIASQGIITEMNTQWERYTYVVSAVLVV